MNRTRTSAAAAPDPTPADLGIHNVEPYTAEELRAMEGTPDGSDEPSEEQVRLAIASASSALPPEGPTQELVPAGIPPTPLHIEVKNLKVREEARETEVRLLHETIARLEAKHAEDVRDLLSEIGVLAEHYAEVVKRLQEVGDWVDAPQWAPAEVRAERRAS